MAHKMRNIVSLILILSLLCSYTHPYKTQFNRAYKERQQIEQIQHDTENKTRCFQNTGEALQLFNDLITNLIKLISPLFALLPRR